MTAVDPKWQGARAVSYKDQLENRKNARELAQHQNQQEQPAQLASRKKDLLAHLEENIRDLGVTIVTDEQTGTIGLKHAASSEIARIDVHPHRYMLRTARERGRCAHDVAAPLTALPPAQIHAQAAYLLEIGSVH